MLCVIIVVFKVKITLKVQNCIEFLYIQYHLYTDLKVAKLDVLIYYL